MIKKKYKHNFTCKACISQYTGTTVTCLHERLDQYKSHVNFYNEGVRGPTKEKMILHIFDASHNDSANAQGFSGSLQPTQLTFTCSKSTLETLEKGKERKQSFWIDALETAYPKV